MFALVAFVLLRGMRGRVLGAISGFGVREWWREVLGEGNSSGEMALWVEKAQSSEHVKLTM